MYVCLSKNGEEYFNEFASPDLLLEEVQTTGIILIVCTNQVNWGDRFRVTRADRQTDTQTDRHTCPNAPPSHSPPEARA